MATESEAYGSGSFLKAKTMMERGQKSLTLTITGVRGHEFADGSRQRVLSFKEIEEDLGLNKTNFRIIADLLGKPDDEDWVGDTITIYTTKTDFQGSRVDCIRVDDRVPLDTRNLKPGNVHAPAMDGETFGTKGVAWLDERMQAARCDMDELMLEIHKIDKSVYKTLKSITNIEDWPKDARQTVEQALAACSLPF